MFQFFMTLFLALQMLCYADYYSQCKQDKFVHENYFNNYKSGVFVDIGAHAGVEISNSYFFEKELGWTGICVEPIPELFKQLKENRSCTCIQGCITDKPGTALFARFNNSFDWFSGLLDKYNENQLKTLQEVYKGTYELITVNCYLINDLLDQQGIEHINFLSIDTEGGEFDILSSIDFSRFTIDVITIEDNFNDPRYFPFFEEKGYEFAIRLDQDLVFVRKGFQPLTSED